ncbi:uncharacterized protein LOC100903583 [Galendromus occidentalis]|uniref:Uncharacterized protein LOC100903583 n=1 Tax=Galendromus occidentalis TaxID=34638 RepID=A0AAJ6QMM5_9ACAR|nr:uncharacterized protein LOC100903583 [Galendromus occidentalis]
MKSFASFAVVTAILISTSIADDDDANANQAENYGSRLCANMNQESSRPELIEMKGNRTTCVLAFTEEVQYTTAVGTVLPEEIIFEVGEIGEFDLKLIDECPTDPYCYRVKNSPGGMFNGNYIYTAAANSTSEPDYIVVYDCRNGERRTQKAEFYRASQEIVDELESVFGLQVSLDELEDCVRKAEEAAEDR